MQGLIVILGIIIIVLTTMYVGAKTDAEMYKYLYDNINNGYYNILCQQLQLHLNEASAFIPEVLDALKYAQKRSHPDNGGSDQEFKKYNKIYEDFLRKTNIN